MKKELDGLTFRGSEEEHEDETARREEECFRKKCEPAAELGHYLRLISGLDWLGLDKDRCEAVFGVFEVFVKFINDRPCAGEKPN